MLPLLAAFCFSSLLFMAAPSLRLQKNECYNDYREKSDRLHELMTMQRNYQMAMPQPKHGRKHEQER